MPAERTVRRLKLRAPDAALARRAQFLLEDALRTASLPGEDAAVVLVRRIALPPIRAAATPHAVAAALEAKCRQLAPLRVDGGAAEVELEAAAAVRFDDTAHACRELAARVLRGERPRAWCWPLAVKGYRPGMGASAALRTILMTLAARDEAPAAVPPWCEAVVAGGGAPRMLAALTTDDAAVLLRVLPAHAAANQGSAVAASRQGLGVADPARAAARDWGEALAWAAEAFSPQDDRLRWFAALAGGCAGVPPAPVAGRGAKAEAVRVRMGRAEPRAALASGGGGEEGGEPESSQPGAGTRSQRLGASARGVEARSGRARRRQRGSVENEKIDGGRVAVREASRRGRGDVETAAGAGPATAAAGRAAGQDLPPDAGGQRARRRPRTGRMQDLSRALSKARARTLGEGGGVASLTPGSGAAATPSAPRAGGVWPQARASSGVALQATAAGGLLFLLPLLEALRFPAWLAARVEVERARLAARLLGAVLDRLRLPIDDPMRCLTAAAVEGGVPSKPGSRLRAARQSRSRASASDAAVDAELAAWLMRCRRWLRGVAGIGLASLVLRRALVAITPTHVDVWLALDVADIRIRRAGLDLDPGWVPWLGRVVCFHYCRERG